jgi:hypothetical protein
MLMRGLGIYIHKYISILLSNKIIFLTTPYDKSSIFLNDIEQLQLIMAYTSHFCDNGDHENSILHKNDKSLK